ncbi:MAG: hypothetical protein J0M24_04795 [Verrucomicrobia bacterium]|nr:hypothetical protein [Verrucomicrobiota bacterium]
MNYPSRFPSLGQFLILMLLFTSTLWGENQPKPSGITANFQFESNLVEEVTGLVGVSAAESVFVDGKSGNAIRLEDGNFVQLPLDPRFAVQNFTVETWVRRRDTTRASQNPSGIAAIFAGSSGAFALSMAADGSLFHSWIGKENSSLHGRVNDLEWHHVALTKDGSVLTFYIDGRSVGSTTTSASYEFTGPFALGGLGVEFDANRYAFWGDLDQLGFYPRALSASEMLSLIRPLATSCVPPPEGLVAWWSGDSTAEDQFGDADGSLSGGASYSDGFVNQGFKFGGGAQRVLIPNTEALHLQDFTIEMWVKRDRMDRTSDSEAGAGLFSSDSGGYSLAFLHEGNLSVSHVGIIRYDTARLITDLNWHHVAVTKSASNLRFYVDGVLREVGTIGSAFTFGGPFAIGANPTLINGLNYSFIGSIDEVSIYNRPLFPEEIDSIWAAGSFGKCLSRIQLRFAEVPNEVVRDTPVSYLLRVATSSTNPVPVTVTNLLPTGLVVTSATTSIGTIDSVETSAGTVLTFSADSLTQDAPAEITVRFLGTTTGLYQIRASASIPDDDNSISASASFLVRPACIPSPTQLTAWWRGESNAVDTIAGRDALATNGLSYTPGRIGTALRLNGQAGSGVSLGGVAALQRSEFTIEGWIRRASLSTATLWGGAGSILGADAGGWNFQLVNNGNLSFGRTDIAGVESGVRIDDLQWHHVALVRTPTEVRFYRDGQLGDTRTFAESIPLDLPYFLGGLPGSGRNGFLGDLDEISFYDRTLSASEIATLASSGGAPKCVEDLLITSTAGGPVALDEDFTSRFVITSIGSDSTAVTFTNAVPPGMQFQSVTSSQGTVQNLAGFLRGSLGTIPAGSNAVVTVVFRPLIEGIYPLTATVGRAESELTLANNRFESTLDVRALAVGLVQDLTVTEEGGKPAIAELEVALNAISTKTVLVDYVTVAGSAVADKDFVPVTGRLEFPPGTVSRHIPITINGDGIFEADETFRVVLTPVGGAVPGKTNAVVTIVSADPRPVLSVVSVQANEGNSGPTPFSFRFQLDRPSDLESSLFFATTNDSARAPTDFVAASGTLTFAPGQTNQVVEVLVNGDSSIEPNELFFLSLSQESGLTLPRAGTPPPSGTILNDDGLISQVAQFSWETPATAVTAGAPFTASLRALDSQGTVVSNFNSVVSLQAFAGNGRPSGVVFTEVAVSPVATVELQNVTTSPVDLSGWTVAFYDSSRWPAPRASLVLPVDTVVPAGGVFVIAAGSGTGAYPNFRLGQTVSWADRGTPQDPRDVRIGVLLVDPFGSIGDAFLADRAQPEEIYIPVQVRADDWSGPSVAPALSNSTGYRRVPHLARNSRSLADWEFFRDGSLNLGRVNAGFVTPFTDSVPLEVVPNTASAFVDGRWTGPLTIRGYGPAVRLLADDGNGHRGLSTPFPMTVVEDLKVELTAMPLLTAPRFSSQFLMVVTNLGASTASNVTAVLNLGSAYSGHNDDGPAPTLSQGTATRTTVFSPGIGQQTRVTVNFGSIPGQSGATLVYTPAGQASAFSATFPTNVVSTVSLTAEPLEFNLLNNTASVTQELSAVCAAVPAELAAWWKGDSTNSLVNGLVGEPTEGLTYTALGRVNGGFEFNGTNAALQVADHPLLNFAADQPFTLEFWVRLPRNSRQNHTVLSKHRIVDSFIQGYAVVVTNGILVLRTGDGTRTTDWIVSNTDLRDEKWHHVAVGRGGNLSHFGSLDGRWAVISGQPIPGDLRSDAPFRLGEPASQVASDYLQGELDEVQVYRQALTSEAIVASYRAGAHGRCVSEFSLHLIQPRFSNQALGWIPEVPGVVGQPYRMGLELRHSGIASSPVSLAAVPANGVSTLQMKSAIFTAEYDPIVGATRSGVISIPVNGTLSFDLNLVSTNLSNPLSVVIQETGASEKSSSLVIELPLQADGDRDGIPDSVETATGSNPSNAADATSDLDGDGWTAAEEFEAGTSANNAASALRLRIVDGQVVIDALSSRVYQLQRRATVGLTDWEVLQTVWPTTDGPIIIGPLLGQDVSGFYRVIVRQPY